MYALLKQMAFGRKPQRGNLAPNLCKRESRGELRGRVGILAASNSAGLGTSYPGLWKTDVILVCS
ncbi:hypothetical protein CY34DRAFT_807089 [Suillus luteus UH-Slu-Lm8-n1]|uniref:Uncharacterized protein n=1 Tax=Suillus luteus UH-Slu-Lm8-n1 TaxID=930992 RepID=A0A0D0BAF8_9AGAM|nr:hypothetical protein CY34DRAFT_807089 [Suillus luteus UH-Slu-Lm8-n1]